MPDWPTGTVTFLFTDIEGSTRLWEQQAEAMQVAFQRQEAILRQAITAQDGYAYKMIGDAFQAAFQTAPAALEASVAAQRALHAEHWPLPEPLRVRMALHTGVVEERGDDYVGPVLNRVARLMAAGHGGQILLTATTRELVQDALPTGTSLRDLHEHRLKDLVRPEHVFQVVAPGLPADFPALTSLAHRPNNLPEQLTTFVGREHEIVEVTRLLAGTHLLTLIGPGGTGKTRLTLEVAARVVDDFADGAWPVELAPLTDPTLVTQGVATALEVREVPGRSLRDVLIDYLRYKQLVLVLDNCEHLVDACATLVDTLLRSCPKLKILASSRESLGIAGETVFRVPSLAVPELREAPDSTGAPPAAGLSSPAALARYPAVRLFVERAQTALPGFELTSTNGPAVAQICRRLDGIPLAIELAAARVRVLTAEQIAARLGDRFRLLTGGSRTAVPRQQTLRALIDWSWELLSEPECMLLRRLSVFAGGWTLDAAERVGGDPDGSAGRDPASESSVPAENVLDVLSQLVNKSLVVVEQTQGTEARYRLLETIRQYARDKLLEVGEAAEVRDRHLQFYLAYAEAAEPYLVGPEMLAWLDRLETEHDNLRAALAWALERDADLALRLAGAIGLFWDRRAYTTEGQRWLRSTLDRIDEVPPVEGEAARGRVAATAKSLVRLGLLEMDQGHNTAARSTLERGVRLARAAGDPQVEAFGLGLLALTSAVEGDLLAALATVEACETLCREHGYTWQRVLPLALRGGLAMQQPGDMAAGRADLEESVRLARAQGNPWISVTTHYNMGTILSLSGDPGEARSWLEEGVALSQHMHDRRFATAGRSQVAHLLRRQGNYAEATSLYHETIGHWLEFGNRGALAHEIESLAFIDIAQSQHPQGMLRAAWLLGVAEAMREAADAAMAAFERPEYDEAVSELRAQLDEATLMNAWAEGRAMTLEQAIAYALREAEVD